MATEIFVNLHVKNLDRSMKFFIDLGFKINYQFTDDTTACVVISDHIYAMLITHDKFSMFTPKEISDATTTTEVLTALSVNSKERVDEILEKAMTAGGTEARPAEDDGFMYGRAFNDLDGHIWEVFWIDKSAHAQAAD